MNVPLTPEYCQETFAEPTDFRTLAQGIYLSTVKSSPLAGTDLRRLLQAHRKPAGLLTMANAIPVICQLRLALEMVEISGVASPKAADEIIREMQEIPVRQIGDSEAGKDMIAGICSASEALISAARAGENPYGKAADLLFDRLGIHGEPRKPLRRGTWREDRIHAFLDNTRIARTYLEGYEELDGQWYRKNWSLFRPVEKGDDPIVGVIITPPAPTIGISSSNTMSLVAVRTDPTSMLCRPSLASQGHKAFKPGAIRLPENWFPMVFIDALLADAFRQKLLAHKDNERYVEMLFTAADLMNFAVITGPDLFPDTSDEGDKSSLADRAAAVLAQARHGDVVFTREPGSELSLQIAELDHGSWSHMLVVLDNLEIVDARPEGIVKANLREYLSGKHRFALCRFVEPSVSPQFRGIWAAETSRRIQETRVGQKYSWLGAIKAALISRFKTRVPETQDATPNAVAYRGNLQPLVVW